MAFPPDPAGVRLGPFWLSPGVTRSHAVTLLFGALCTLCLLTFATVAQPYLFSIVGIPQGRQGSLSGLLVGLQEGTQVLLAGLVGALSDRTGRRVVYVTGIVVMAASYGVFPLASSEAGLVLVRLIYAVGMVASTLMMVTCVAEYTQDATRGRWMGMVGICNGVGVVLMTAVLAKLPDWLGQRGFDSVASIRYTFWVFAACLLLLALFLRVGLRGHVRNAGREELTLVRRLTIGATAARENPRIALAYLLAFASRGDLLIIVTFTFLWVIQAGLDAGLTPAAATAKAGMIFGISQGFALLWSLAMGVILDRVPRLTGVCVAFGIAGLGYSALGQVDDPFGSWMLPAAILAGIGEASAVVAAGVLIGQEAPAAIRGTLIGVYGLCGSLGIVCLTYVGGQVFDSIGRSAPFVMMGIVNFAVLGVALWVRNTTTTHLPESASITGTL